MSLTLAENRAETVQLLVEK